MIELEKIELIKTVLVQPRVNNNRFTNIHIEIGLTQNSMKKFASYGSTNPNDNEIIIFQGEPIKGKFIRILKKNEHLLIIAELAILGV